MSASHPDPAGPSAGSEEPDTATRVLDAAEALFIEHGFAAASVRAIAAQAGVNLGAAHYHFGSKEGLLAAVMHRRVEPLNALRHRALDELEASGKPPDVRAILEAFLSPLRGDDVPVTVPPLMGRLYGEPERISRPLIEQEFGATFERFVALLAATLPAVPEVEVRWRFHFTIGAMIHQLATEAPLHTAPDRRALDRLLAFAAAGIEHTDGAARQETA